MTLAEVYRARAAEELARATARLAALVSPTARAVTATRLAARAFARVRPTGT